MSVRTKMGRKFLSGISVIALTALVLPAVDAAAQGEGQGGQGAGKGQAMQRGGQGKSADERGGMGGDGSLGGLFRDITGEDTDEDSDRPDWAGTPGGGSDHGGGRPDMAGSKRGDMFGDLFVIMRDEDGVPVLTDEGWVQPIDAEGDPLELDEDGHPVDPAAAIEVELGRLNVGRAPTSVIDRRAEEVITVLSEATAIRTDAAGRLVLTVDGEEKTIDSPLENLAIYKALVTTGSIPGLEPSDIADAENGDDFTFLVDGQYTPEDLAASASFLAAATDKTGEFTTDEIAYINAFLGINTTTEGDNVTYSVIDYDPLSYDRSDTYDNVMATVLVAQPDGTYLVETVDVFDAVFGGEDVEASGTLNAYAIAADDARQVVNYLHEYEVPAPTTN